MVNNKLLLYADDSAILVADKHISNIEKLLKKELETVSDWLIDNKLSLHLGKTESILFGSKIKLKSESNLNISCRGTDIEPKEKSSIWVQLWNSVLAVKVWSNQLFKRLMLD